MKRNAIARIVIYSILLLIMTGILMLGIAAEFFMVQFGSGDNVPKEGYAPGDVRNIEINWAGGTVTVQRGTGSEIIFYESAPDGCWYNMEYEYDGYSLTIDYGSKFTVGKTAEKDLTICVPQDWTGEELEINGAGLVIQIENVDIHTLELDGAGCEVDFSGAITHLQVNGAGAELALHCKNQPEQLDINGMGCAMDLKLPKDCGFSVRTNGLGCAVNTNMSFAEKDGRKVYGNGQCAIEVNGLGCRIDITENSD